MTEKISRDHAVFGLASPLGRTLLIIAFVSLLYVLSVAAQAPEASPTTVGGYTVTATTEFGWRWKDVSGSEKKYRSDLNYKQGFRTFDSNILFEAESGKGKWFDSLFITNTGWGSDPSGFTRVNMERTGAYKFNANVRQIKYFNDLSNVALGQHTSNTKHTFADFDGTILPQNEKIRFILGASFGNMNGPGFNTSRAYSDEFPVTTNTKNRTDDYRVGIEGRVVGLNYGLTQGVRNFRDRTFWELTAPHPGNNPTNNATFATFRREMPTDGKTYFTQGFLNKTFAERLEVTARGIYASTDSAMSLFETITGRDNSNNFVDLDRFLINSYAKRIQKRGDLGATWMATNDFRISNSFTIDAFTINGGEDLDNALFRRNSGGTPLATAIVRSNAFRITDYLRYSNLAEGDYQVNRYFGFHVGYRFTHRKVDIAVRDTTLTSPPSGTNPRIVNETEENSTHTLIAGVKIKVKKYGAIFSSIEKGTADNVFSRVENYKFTNYKVRGRFTFNKVGLSLSAMTKDNTNPSTFLTNPNIDFTTRVKTRYFSSSMDWTPADAVMLSGGYSYRHLDSYTPIILPLGGVQTQGTSEFFARDHFGHVDISVKAGRRVGFYGSYRISKDNGQGSRIGALPQNLVGSYPMSFTSPEIKVSIKLNRNIDWNAGYQYYKYSDVQTPSLNYRSHLPFTSLRIFFGGRANDR